MSTTHSSLSERITLARTARGLTPEALSEAIGVDWRTVYRWEAGDNTPRLKTCERIAEATGVRQDWLLSGEGAMEPPDMDDAMPSHPQIDASTFAHADLVPIFDHATVEAAATQGGVEIDAENVTGLLWIPRVLLRELFGVEDPYRVRRITVTGSSMYPTLVPGQKIWVVQAVGDDLPMSGAVYLIRGPYGLFVKRLIVGSVPVRPEDRAEGGGAREYRVTLVSGNADKERYADEIFPLETFRRDFVIIGHVPRVETAL